MVLDIYGQLNIPLPQPKTLRLSVVNRTKAADFSLTVLALPDVGGVIQARQPDQGEGKVDNTRFEGDYRVISIYTDAFIWPKWDVKVEKL